MSTKAGQLQGIAQSLEVIGIVDRDYHSDNFLAAMPTGVHPVPLHEVESLIAMPAVVQAAAQHTGHEFDLERYLAELRATVNEGQRHAIVIRRWKARIEPQLTGLVASTGQRDASLEALIADMPSLFDMNEWTFSPQQILEEEKARVEAGVETGTAEDFLSLVPGKQCAPVAAQQLGMTLEAYTGLIVHALDSGGEGDFKDLHTALDKALKEQLPPRAAAGQEQAADAAPASA